jgi:transcriptional regulator with XRE-family HTH domain
MRRKKETMTAAELAATRERLGWSLERMSEEVGILPAEVQALEAGSFPVPAETAEDVRMLVVLEERRAILRASGLPECGELGAMEAAFPAAAGRGEESRDLAIEAMLSHEAECPVCRARVAYLEAHAPPMPRMRLPLWMRALGWLGGLADRLPAPLRPPPGPRGEYRRFGIVIGGYFTAFASAIIGFGVVWELVAGRAGEDSVLGMALALPALAAAYLVGGYVAGGAWDATRRIRHRFIGYVLRGGGTAAAMYGVVGLVAPLMVDDGLPLALYPVLVAGTAVLGGMIGAGKWLRDRWMHDLPEPPAEETPA